MKKKEEVVKSFSIAVDIGGTFTDLLAFDRETGRIYQAKCLSTPPDFASGVLDGIHKADLDLSAVESFVHGSTVAINTAIEHTGARTALVVTKGARDVYQIGRGNRPESYNILFKRAEPLVPPSLTFEIDQRTTAWGESIIPLDVDQSNGLACKLKELEVESVAICFLHSYESPADEARVAEIIRQANESMFVTASHEITRRAGEYERTSTTVLNAYVGPKCAKYIQNLMQHLGEEGFEGRLLIMQSNGGLMSADTAKQMPVAMMESGPVGGVIAAAQISSNLGFENSIAFDMGGTTAKASLVHGREPSVAEGYFIGGYASGHPAMMPVVDIVEVGTGGGSIAWLDEVGALKVGPHSAGAAPGPISYGRGGTKPTVTDANVVLGRIGADSFLGGEMKLALDQAMKGMNELGSPLGLDGIATAFSIIEIAVAKMSLAVRGVSVERGFDPRDFVLVGTGGAGPLHAVLIARDLNIPRVIIPVMPSHFSALGMLMSDVRHDYVRTHMSSMRNADFGSLGEILAELVDEARETLKRESIPDASMSFQRFLDLRYEGQEFFIKVPVSAEDIEAGDIAPIRERFDAIHERNFGHSAPDEPVELVGLRLTGQGSRRKIEMPEVVVDPNGVVKQKRKVCFEDPGNFVDCFVYRRETLPAGTVVTGPALIEEYGSTTVLFDKDRAQVAPTGEIVISIKGVE